MSTEFWQQLNELFHLALERKGSERQRFVEACPDEELRRELNSMLEHHNQAHSFIESPTHLKPERVLSNPPQDRLAGIQLGHYRVHARIAIGGMGEVYLAQDVRLGRLVALKLLPQTFFEDTDRLKRFEREARAASALNHPNIVTIYEIGKAEQGPFIAMELVEGKTLREIIQERPPISTVLQIARQMAAALRVAHAAGIVHRDIKPENVIVRSDGYAKVFDFGLAKMSDRGLQQHLYTQSSDSHASTEVSVNTNPGMILGTIVYMSPEQARAETIGSSTDIFSLGVVMYELATGQHPFKRQSQVDTLHMITSQQPLSPSRLDPEVPRALDNLILQMLNKESKLRPTASEVETTLSGLVDKNADVRIDLASETPHTVGRQKERTQLQDAFLSMTSGRGVIYCIAGEPGIGKTTLVEDFLRDLSGQSRNYILARGRCSERLAGTEAYLPLLDALEALVRGDGGESIVRAMKLVAPTWYSLMLPTGAVTFSSEETSLKAVSQERMKRELGALMEEVSRLRPLVLFIDDLHWADVSTVDFFPYLASKFDSLQVMIVATYRPSELFLTKHPFMQVKLELQTRGNCKEIHLEFLNREDVDDYLKLEFPAHKFPEQFSALIHNRTEGSPLFMVELLKYLRDQKTIVLGDLGWKLTQSVFEIERHLPESVRSMVQKKVDQLSADDHRLLAVASVQGYEFDSAVIAKVLSVDPVEIEERLEHLDRVHSFVRLAREQELPDLTLTLHYRFVHVLYQNALYQSLTPGRRSSLSATVAQAIESFVGDQARIVASELAFLWEVARDFRRASDYFLLAAKNAARVFANQEAIELARRGLTSLEKLPDTPERAQKELTLHITLGVPLMAIKGYGASEVAQSYTRARELSQRLKESPRAFLIVAGLWAYYMIRAELTTARELAEQCLRLAEQVPTFLVQAHWMMENTLLHLGDLELAQDYSEKGIAFYDPKHHRSYASRYGHDLNVARLSHSARTLWLLGYPDLSLKRVEEALNFAEKLAHRPSKAFALFLASYIHECRGEWMMTQRRAQAAIAISRELELANWPTWSSIMLGRALTEQGKTHEGIALILESLAELRLMGSEISRAHFLALLAESLQKEGRTQEAFSCIHEALEASDQSNERYYEPELHRLKGELLLAQLDSNGAAGIPTDNGNVTEAHQCFDRAIQIARHQAAKSLELRAVMSQAKLLRRQGKSADAHNQLSAVYEWFTEGFDTADLKSAKSLLAELSSDVSSDSEKSNYSSA